MLLTTHVHAVDELDLLGQPSVRTERTVRSQQQVLWTLPFETTRYVPEHPTPAMRNAMAAQQAGRYIEAIAILEEEKGESSLPDTQLLRAGFYLQGDQARYAQEILTALLQQSPQASEAHALLAMALLQQGQLDAALAAVERAQKLGERPLVTQISTYVLQARGRLEQASEVMAVYNAKNPGDALGLAREAELALNLGDKRRAAERAAEAHKLAPQSPYVMAVIGLVWLIEDKPAEAQRAFEMALQSDPEDAKALLGLGLAKARQGKLEESLEHLRKAASVEPENGMIQTYLGRALHQVGRYQEAQAAYQSAIKLDPQDPAPWTYLAQSQTELGQPGEALNSLNQAAERKAARAVYRGQYLLSEDEQTLQTNQAEAYEKLGLRDMAWFALTEGTGEKNAVTLKNQAEILHNLRFGETARRSLALQSLFNDSLDALPVTLDVYGDGSGRTGANAPQHGMVEGLSGQQASYGDYGALFVPPTHVRTDGIVGNRDTWGEQIRGAAGAEQFGFSLAQLHYETDGFSSFDNLDNTTWQGVLKWNPSDSTRFFASYQDFNSNRGETLFPADPWFGANADIHDENWVARLGLRQRLGNGGELRGLLSRQLTDQKVDYETFPPSPFSFSQTGKSKADSGELQYRQTTSRGLFVAGLQTYYEQVEFPGVAVNKIHAGQVYASQKIHLDEHWGLDLGMGRAWLENKDALYGLYNTELHRWTPRLGLIYTPAPVTHFRLALGQSLGLPETGGASLAPAETFGILKTRPADTNKLVKSGGLGFDHRLGADWLVSGEGQIWHAWIPVYENSQKLYETRYEDGRLSLAWVPAASRLAASLSAGYEHRSNPDYQSYSTLDSVQEQRLRDLKLTLNWFVNSRLSLKGEVSGNWVDGKLAARDDFFNVYLQPYRDASIQISTRLRWQLPRGLVEFGVLNLLDDELGYSESDPLSPRFSAGRFVYGSVKLSW